jgi:hypothetical protein
MTGWIPLTVSVAAALGVTAAGAVGVATLRWNGDTRELRTHLFEADPTALAPFDPRELAAAPAPVARYFARVLTPGQRLIARARIEWAGEFNMGRPGADKWTRFTAVQDFLPSGPGMLWDARIAMAPGVPVRVRDALVGGVGSMQGAVFGLVPVVDKAGTPELAAASLQRYLAEATWLPTALLPSQGVHWSAIDDHRARATLRAGQTTASVEFRFTDDDLISSMYVPDRLFDDGRTPATPQAWQGRIMSVTTRDGMVVPDESVVEWLLPGGVYAYWRARPTTIAYTYAPPAAPSGGL